MRALVLLFALATVVECIRIGGPRISAAPGSASRRFLSTRRRGGVGGVSCGRAIAPRPTRAAPLSGVTTATVAHVREMEAPSSVASSASDSLAPPHTAFDPFTGVDTPMPTHESLATSGPVPFELGDLPQMPGMEEEEALVEMDVVAPARPRLAAWALPAAAAAGLTATLMWAGVLACTPMMLLGADMLSSCLAAFGVAPAVALVDSAIARASSTASPPTTELARSVRELALQPRASLSRPDFKAVHGVYLATFLTANVCATLGVASLLKMALITTVNMWAGVKKDALIATSNAGAAGGAAPAKVPRSSVALFCARDTNAIGASFVVPRVLAPRMAMLLPGLGGAADTLCQLIVPPICELINTPIHLLALDMYNRPGCGKRERARSISKQYSRSLAVRIVRVMAAFSLGGIGNRVLRTAMHGMVLAGA